MAKEFAAYHGQVSSPEISFLATEETGVTPPHHEFPIPSYTKEHPGIPLPETYDFLSTRDLQVRDLLLPVFEDTFFQQNLVKLQRKLHRSEIPDNSRMGLENALSGFIFEEVAHRYLAEGIQDNSILLTPQETRQLSNITGIQENIKERFRTVPDGLVLQPVKNKSYIVGSCEYTIRTNLGDMEMPYRIMNKDKRKQLKLHTSGKVVYDLFTRQPPNIQEKVANAIHSMRPELPPKLAYDSGAFKAILVTTTEHDTPFSNEKCELVRVPISSNEIWYASMSIVNELNNSPAYFDSHPQKRRNEHYSAAAD